MLHYMTNNNINPEQPRATPSNPKQTLSDSKQPRGLISLFYVTDYLVHCPSLVRDRRPAQEYQ